MNIPLFRPDIGSNELDLVTKVLNSKDETNMSGTLEKNITGYLGCPYVTTTVNSTAALHLSLSAMDLKRGDKIICSVNSFPAVAEVIRHFDAEPIFVDIDQDDFNIDVKQFERVLRLHNCKKLRGAFIGHIAGQPSDLEPLYEIASEYNIKIIDDATQALGANYKGKKIGNTGSHISCFRFGSQMRNPVAPGGIMATKDEEIYKRATLLKNHAITSDGWDKYGNLGYTYDVVDIGLKYDMSEICAAFNIAQLAKIEKSIKRRQEIAKLYDEELKDCPHVKIPVKKREHIYSKYIIKIDKNRDGFAKALKEKNISTGLHFVPLHLLQYYKTKYSLKINDYPVALSNYQHILSIPIFETMSDDMVMYVCENIKKIASNRV